MAAHIERIYRLIVEQAKNASGTRAVQLNSYDAGTQEVSNLAFAGLGSSVAREALAVIAAFAPGFDPTRVISRADQHQWNQRVYLEGKVAEAPLHEMAEGVVPRRIIQLASSIVGMRYTYVHPLKEGERVFGSLAAHGARPFTPAQKRTLKAFAGITVQCLQNAVRVDRLMAGEVADRARGFLRIGTIERRRSISEQQEIRRALLALQMLPDVIRTMGATLPGEEPIVLPVATDG